jgi:hypothetical protein
MGLEKLVLGSVNARVQVQSMTSYFATSCFLLLLSDQEQSSLWMFWIIMESMQWNAKLQHKVFSRN